MSIRSRRAAFLVGAAISTFSVAGVHAADYSWINFAAGTYDWTNTANWNPTGAPLGADGAGDGANVSGPLSGGNLQINLPSDVYLGTLTLGSTSGAFQTNLASTGGKLIFTPASTLTSVGVAGSANLISAPVQLSNNITLADTSTSGLTLSGALSQVGADRTITNNLGAAYALTVSGPVTLTETGTVLTTGRILSITGTGTTILTGALSDGAVANGRLTISGTNNGAPRPTVVLNANNHTGITQLNRGTLILNSDSALGAGLFQEGGQSASYQRWVVSTSDSRTIANNVALVNHLVFAGEHSLTISGFMWMSSTRTLVNNISPDKTLKFTGGVAICSGSDTARTMTLDGWGHTILDCNLYNHRNPYFAGASGDAANDTTATGSITKGGTGILTLNGLGSTYKGATLVQGGLLEYAAAGAYGATASITVSAGGAIGLLTGTTSDAAFLSKIIASTSNSKGALALSSADAAANIDFTTGTFADPKLVQMSIGAVSSGVSYTGTITPAASEYRLGGGGKLTLPSNSALSGANAVSIRNGGTVELTGSNSYSGLTKVTGQYIVPTQAQAAAQTGNTDLNTTSVTVRENTALTVSQLANGGTNSSIGASSSDAANLLLDGATFTYTGAAGSTDRNFTISPNGATIQSSGSGPIVFTNTAAVAMADAATRGGTLSASNKTIATIADTTDLSVGMTVTGVNVPAGATIVALTGNQIVLSAAPTVASTDEALTFGNQNRTLTLGGSNTGANSIAGVLGDSPTGKISLTKTGAGKWIASGSNTYTGTTTVSSGTLQLGKNAHTPVLSGTVTTGAVVDSALVLDYSGGGVNPSGSVNTILAATYAANADFSTGVIRSTKASGNRALGWRDDGSAVTILNTFDGDANLDGKVNTLDFNQLAGGFGAAGQVWSNGNLNYDANVDSLDFNLLAGTYGMSLPPASATVGAASLGATVPEPASLSLLALAAGCATRRRRTM